MGGVPSRGKRATRDGRKRLPFDNRSRRRIDIGLPRQRVTTRLELGASQGGISMKIRFDDDGGFILIGSLAGCCAAGRAGPEHTRNIGCDASDRAAPRIGQKFRRPVRKRTRSNRI